MKHLLFLFLFCLSLSASAHFGVLRGNISDKTNNLPLEGVSIYLSNTSFIAKSDDQGLFLLSQIPEGKYTLFAEREGFLSESKNIEILADDTLDIELILTAEPYTIPTVLLKADRATSAASSLVINSIDFDTRPKNSAQDMLRMAPGLFIAQHAGGGKAEQIFVRGFDCDHGTDVAAFVDGIAVNMPSHGHGQGYMDLHFLIPETVRNLEVFKGPYFAQFGDFATAAAVQFNTHSTLENNLIKIEATSTPTNRGFSGSRALLMYQLPLTSERITSYFAGEIVNNAGYFEQNQRFIRNNLFSKTTYKISQNATFTLSASNFASSWNASGQIPTRAVESNTISRWGSIDPSEGGTTQRQNLSATYASLGENSLLETQVYVSNYRFRLFSNFSLYLNDSLRGDEIEQTDSRNIVGLNSKYSRIFSLGGKENRLTFGANFRIDNIENQLFCDENRIRLRTNNHHKIHQNSNAIYVKNEIQLSKKLRAEIGLRANYFIFDVEDVYMSDSVNSSAYNFQTQVAPKLNVIYALKNNVKFFVNMGKGFHSNDARSASLEVNNHNLPASWGGEIGTQWFTKNTLLSLALWEMDTENELVYIGDAGTTEDKGASRRYGIEASFRAQAGKHLFLDIDLNAAKSVFTQKLFGEQITKDFYVPLAPRFTSTGGITYRNTKGLTAALRYRAMTNRPANESNTIIAKGYCLLDANVAYALKNYSFQLNLENLLNSQWSEAQFATESRLKNELNPVEEIHFTPGTPLALRLSVSRKF